MIPGRLRECLKSLRWDPTDLAEQLGCPESSVITWLDGRAVAPIAVAAWLEALVKAHKALPPPSLINPKSTPVNGPITVPDVDISTRTGAGRHYAVYPSTPRHSRDCRTSRVAVRTPEGVSNHATHPL